MSSYPSPRILMGPGPSCVSANVLSAMSIAPVGYLDPELFQILDSIRVSLRRLFETDNEFTIPITGTGMAGMECCLANTIEHGDKVVVGVNGFFGARIAEIAGLLGADVTVVNAEWGHILEPDMFRKAVSSLSNIKLAACVQAETSTGIYQPLEEISSIAHEHGALFLADAVTSLGGMPVQTDVNHFDICYSAVQKCVGAPPGLSPITVSEKAFQLRLDRKSPLSHWFFDWKLLHNFFDGNHVYHHTVPVNHYYALKAALDEIEKEGLPERWERHKNISSILINELAELGIVPFAQEGYRLTTLNAVIIPEHIHNEAEIRSRLLQEYGIEIGSGLGVLKGRIWRIGTMGASATLRNVQLTVAALKKIISQ